MSGTSFSLTLSNNTAAAFRLWGSTISAQIAALGLVQTADTGQINWTTVAAPASGNQSMGYEIWRFNDTLQATAPVYLKLEYGAANVGAAAPQIWVTAGTGTDGAGTITGTAISGVAGAVTTRSIVMQQGASPFPATGTTYINGDSGCLALLICPNVVSTSFSGTLLLVERSRAWDGSAAGDGVHVIQSAGAQSGSVGFVNRQEITFIPGMTAQAGATSSMVAGINQANKYVTTVKGGICYPLPVYLGGPGTGGPSQYVMGVVAGDVPAAATFTMSHYGTSHTWYSPGVGNGGTATGYGTWLYSAVNGSFVFRID